MNICTTLLAKIIMAVVLLFLPSIAFTQQAVTWPVKSSQFYQGFEAKVSGEVLDFLPGLTSGQVALLVRAGNGSSTLEFESSIIPQDYNKPYVSLVWSAAISRRLQEPPGSFDVFINNEKKFTFRSHKDSLSCDWSLKSGNTDLSFVATEITKDTQDAFGYMFLNLPTSSIKKGERISIKVVGGNQGSMDWYMPFGIPVTNEQHILAEPALVKTKDGPKQRIRVEIKHAGSPSQVEFRISGKSVRSESLKAGKRIFYLLHEPVATPKQVSLEVSVGGKELRAETITLNPVRKFEVFFLAHSHVDIGFTHKQEDVEKLQWRNFELGIKLAEKTKDYPDGSRFKWNAEITWAIEGYLKNAPEEKKQKFIDAVRKGWIGLDALYASQLTGLQREEEMINNQRYAGILKDAYGFDITTAMISDVPGYSWGMVESLAQSGVRYFSSGPNHMPHLPHGGYQVGHTFEAWGDVPFYWASASGKQKILFWMTSHGYSWFHSWSVDILSKAGGDPVVKFLDELEKQKYPYDIVQLRYTIGNDNGPPDETMPDFIRKWNETYEYPKMRIATNREMMEAFEKRYGDQLPTYKGDFTPYWEDGAASSALETGINRRSADALVQAEALTAMLNVKGNTIARFDDAWRNVVLFSEHTWGANVSKSQPDSEFTKSLWSVKQSFALDGQQQSKELVNDALRSIASKETEIRAFQVINTSSWPRMGLVNLPSEWSLHGKMVVDESGKPVETQVLSDGSMVFVAKDVPALGSKKYFFKKVKTRSTTKAADTSNTLSNGSITVTLNDLNGDISSISWNGGTNYVDEKDTLGFNAYWYGGLIKSDVKKQSGATFQMVEQGDVLTRLRVTTIAPGAESLTREIQLVKGLNNIYLTNIVDKKRVIEDENVRFTFPFNIPGSQVRIDIPWATVRPEQDQLKGANKNFYSVQRWVDVSNDKTGITMATLEAPLLEIGDMNGQKWMTDMKVRPWIKKYEPSNKLFSWVMNNAWFVNYRAFQDGKIPFQYVLKPHGAFSEIESKKFGIEQAQPLLVVPVDKAAAPITPLLKLNGQTTIIISSLKKSRDGKAVMIRFFNPSGKSAATEIDWSYLRPKGTFVSSPREERGVHSTNNLAMDPWEIKTLRVEIE
jgi:alpha-mannosidase